MTLERDGRTWRVGTAADVEWIEYGTHSGLEITSAIAPVFEAYATIVVDGDRVLRAAQGRAMLRILAARSADQPWWLGYLETGADDFDAPDAPRIQLYANWSYVLVEAGPEQAATWRPDGWRGTLPDLMFPAGRSWLISQLWDDEWWCLGGPAELVEEFRADPALQARPVPLGVDATPPGHVAR